MHRIGRTGRAGGASGKAVTVVTDEKDPPARDRARARPKISILPLDRSGIRIPVERPVQAQAAVAQSSRSARAAYGQQRGHGQAQGGHGRRGGRSRGR